MLMRLVAVHGKQWGLIASQMTNRSASQVAARWEKCLDPRLLKGPFTEDEDRAILDHIANHGPQNWPLLSQVLKHRSPKQCRERWCNHLNPAVSLAGWTFEEDALILEHYERYGPKWSLISKAIPGRTDNAIKNRWNSSIAKRIQAGPNGRRILTTEVPRRRHPPARPPPIQTLPPMAGPIVGVDLGRLAPWQVSMLTEMNILPGRLPSSGATSPPFRLPTPPSPFPTLTTPGPLFPLGDGADTPFSPSGHPGLR